MKYCVVYTSKLREPADEVIVQAPIDKSLARYMEQNPQTAYTFVCTGSQDLQDIIEIHNDEKYKDYDIRLEFSSLLEFPPHIEVLRDLHKHGIPYRFAIPATNWTQFHCLLATEPCAIYIKDDLLFEIKKASKVASERGVKLKVIPNFLPEGESFAIDDSREFFVFPHWTHIYEDYIDTFDLIGHEFNINSIVKAYKSKMVLREDPYILTFGLPEKFDPGNLPDAFAAHRLDCGRACLKGSSCNICGSYLEAAKKLTVLTREEEAE